MSMIQEKQKSMFEIFPVTELARMIQNIDRFDTDVPKMEKTKAEEAISKAEEVTEKMIEENL